MFDQDHLADAASLESRARALRSLTRSLIRDPERAEDLEQRVWLEALQANLGGIRHWRAWCRKVALNLIRSDARAKQTRRVLGLASEPTSRLEAPDKIVEQIDVHRRLMRGLRDLPEPYRSTVFLRFFSGLSPSEIANREGESASTVRSRLSRGLQLLRATLDREQAGDRRAWALPLVTSLVGPGKIPAPSAPSLLTSPLAASALTGVLVMKKTLIVGVVALLLFGAWFLLSAPGESDLDLPGSEFAPRSTSSPNVTRANPSHAKGSPAPADPKNETAGVDDAPTSLDALASIGGLVMAGVVHDSDGRGIPNAIVRLVRAGNEGELAGSFDFSTQGESSEDQVLTAADGTFQVETKNTGEFELIVFARGFLPGRESGFFASDRQRRLVVDLVLQSLPKLACVAIGVDEEAVAGAKVSVELSFGEGWEFSGNFLKYETVTKGDGSFELERMPPSRLGFFAPPSERVRIVAPGVLESSWVRIQQLSRDDRGRAVFRLKKGRPLALRFEDEAGQPVENLSFELKQRIGEWTAQGKSDEDGRAHFASVPKDKVLAIATRSKVWMVPTAKNLYGNAVRHFDLPAGDGDEVLVTLTKPYTLEGVVVDIESGARVAGVELRVAPSVPLIKSGKEAHLVGGLSDESGAFRIDGLRDGSQKLSVISSEWSIASRSKATSLGPLQTLALDLSGGGIGDVRVQVRRNAELQGRVVDVRGTGVAAAQVGVERMDVRPPHYTARRPIQVITDDQGNFRLMAVPASIARHLLVRHPEFATARVPFKVASGAVLDDLIIELSAGASLTVKVLDGNEKPVENAGIRLGSGTGVVALTRSIRNRLEQRASTDAQGRAELPRLTVGPSMVMLTDVSPSGSRFENKMIPLVLEQGAQEITISLDGQQSVRGRILTTNGKPLRGARLSFDLPGESGRGAAMIVLTNSDGYFSFQVRAPKGLSQAEENASGFSTTKSKLGRLASEGEAGWSYELLEIYTLPEGSRGQMKQEFWTLMGSPVLYPRLRVWEIKVSR